MGHITYNPLETKIKSWIASNNVIKTTQNKTHMKQNGRHQCHTLLKIQQQELLKRWISNFGHILKMFFQIIKKSPF